MVSSVNVEWKRKLTITGIIAGVYVGYRFFLPAVIPFVTAVFLAGWLYPAAVCVEKKTGIKRGIVGTILLTLLFAALGILAYWGILGIMGQLQEAVANIPALLKTGERMLDSCCGFLEEVTGHSSAETKRYLMERGANIMEVFLSALTPENIGKIVGMAKHVILFISGLVVTYISTSFIMGDMENLQKKIREYSWLAGIRRAFRRLKETTAVYFKAQLLIMAIIAGVCAVGFWLMKSPYFLVFGIALGILDAIPLIGTGTILYPAAIVFLIRGEVGIAVGCVILDLVTSFLREVLEARLLGGRLGVSPLVILGCVYIGVLIFGGAGVILGPLAFSTAYELGKEWDVWD